MSNNKNNPKFIHQVTKMYDMQGKEHIGRDRESYFLLVPGRGAVEAWRTKSPSALAWTETGYYGGIEMHYKNDPGETFQGAELTNCWITGGKCWADGSSLAFDQVEHRFNNPAYIRSVLNDWAAGRLIFDAETI